MPLRSFHLSAGAAVLAACLAACSDNSGPSSTSGAMTAAEADSLAQVLTDDADEVVAAIPGRNDDRDARRVHPSLKDHAGPWESLRACRCG